MFSKSFKFELQTGSLITSRGPGIIAHAVTRATPKAKDRSRVI